MKKQIFISISLFALIFAIIFSSSFFFIIFFSSLCILLISTKKDINVSLIKDLPIETLNIPMGKKLNDFTIEEQEKIKESITIDCTNEFKAARKKYIEPNKNTIYDYPEIQSLDEDTIKNLLNDIYYNIEDGWKKDFTFISIKDKYSAIDSQILDYIQLYEQNRYTFLMKQYKNEEIGLYWYRWKAPDFCKISSVHKLMGDVIVYYDNPPCPEKLNGEKSNSYYHAGIIPYCHCHAQPIMTINEIFEKRKSIKLYWNDKIHKLTKNEFMQFINDNHLKQSDLWKIIV